MFFKNQGKYALKHAYKLACPMRGSNEYENLLDKKGNSPVDDNRLPSNHACPITD